MSHWEAVLVQQNATGEFWKLYLYRRVLKEHSGGYAGTAE